MMKWKNPTQSQMIDLPDLPAYNILYLIDFYKIT